MKVQAETQLQAQDNWAKFQLYAVISLSVAVGFDLALTFFNYHQKSQMTVANPWLFAIAIVLYLGSLFLQKGQENLRILVLVASLCVLVAATSAHFVGFATVFQGLLPI